MKYFLKKYQHLLVYIITITLLSSCISSKETNFLQDREPIYPAKKMEEYKLQVNDEVSCIILTSNTEFANSFNGIIQSIQGTTSGGRGNTSYTVYENGNISIPFFGDVHVIGMTIREAEEAIQRRMRASFPDAMVKLNLRNNIYYVVSSGKNGTYNVVKENMTIYQALAISGKIDETIDLTNIKIVRKENGRDVIKTFNLRTESVIESEFYYIKPNDVIYYSTSKNSFFRINSFGSLLSTVIAPISFLFTMIAWRNSF